MEQHIVISRDNTTYVDVPLLVALIIFLLCFYITVLGLFLLLLGNFKVYVKTVDK